MHQCVLRIHIAYSPCFAQHAHRSSLRSTPGTAQRHKANNRAPTASAYVGRASNASAPMDRASAAFALMTARPQLSHKWTMLQLQKHKSTTRPLHWPTARTTRELHLPSQPAHCLYQRSLLSHRLRGAPSSQRTQLAVEKRKCAPRHRNKFYVHNYTREGNAPPANRS